MRYAVVLLCAVVCSNAFGMQGPSKICHPWNPLSKYSLDIDADNVNGSTKFILVKDYSSPIFSLTTDLAPFEGQLSYQVSGTDAQNRKLTVQMDAQYALVTLQEGNLVKVSRRMKCTEL